MKVLKEDVTIRFKGATWDYGDLTVPKGTRVTHETAMGKDEKYNFVDDFSWVKDDANGKKDGFILHDLEHYGLDIPAKFIVEASELDENVDSGSGHEAAAVSEIIEDLTDESFLFCHGEWVR